MDAETIQPPGREGEARSLIRVLELRSVWGTGGGPDKTILLGAERTDPQRFLVTVCYLRDRADPLFPIEERARGRVDYVEIRERHSFDPQIWRSLRRLVRERRFDIVHAHDYKTDFLAYLLSRFEPVVPLATAHGWIRGTRREKLYYSVDRRLLAWFPRAIAVSTPIRDDLLRAGAQPSRVELLLNGIDPQVFRRDPSRRTAARAAFGIEGHAVLIGAVGRLEREKRFDILLEAFALLAATRPGLRLMIAGEGSLSAELKAHAERLGFASRVVFPGHVDDIIAFHHAVDAFVQSSDREGTPNAVLEAMALETPVVATEVGGTAELARNGEHALLVPPNDPRALADAVERVLNDGGSASRRSVAARRRIEDDLSFDARTRALEAIYEAVLGEARPSKTPNWVQA